MARFTFLTRSFPTKKELTDTIFSFSKRQWIFFIVFFMALFISALSLVYMINEKFIVAVPTYGGHFTEGVVSTPRFINPVLALSDADYDLTTLVYSGLMRKMPNGDIIPDLAEKYEVSSDGLTYTFTLKNDITFHNGSKVTADDIVYTIGMAKDSLIKSPKKINWDGVDVTKTDDKTIVFSLKQRYAGFLENTTIGILPAKIWRSLSPEEFSLTDLNIKGVGSGPYKIRSVKKTSSGIPASYELEAFKNFALGEPYIRKMTVKFYSNEKDLVNAYSRGDVDNISAISPESAGELNPAKNTIQTTNLPRIFGLFFNPNEAPIFQDTEVIKAFDTAVNKDHIINEVLGGYGQAIDSPIPPHLLKTTEFENAEKPSAPGDIEAAKKILEKDGWTTGADGILTKKKDKKTTLRLAFSISTSDTPELKNAAQFIKEDLEKVGAQVDLKIFETGTLNQTIIRPRKYDAVFFGQVVSHETDLFAFWHSSQRNDPGLNIAEYTSAKADALLEEASGTLDQEKRTNLYLSFEQQVKKDMPALFVYSPDFIYAVDPHIHGIILNRLTAARDRFASVYTWYKETDKIWKVFIKNNTTH